MGTYTDQALKLMGNGSLGAAAYWMYQEIIEREENVSAWQGLAAILDLLEEEPDLEVIVSRYALSKAPYDAEMIYYGKVALAENPRAFTEWLFKVARKIGGSSEERKMLAEIAEEVEQLYNSLLEQEDEVTLEEEYGMLPLVDLAAEEITLEWGIGHSGDEVIAELKEWLEDPTLVLPAVKALAFFLEPGVEALLRRICRQEDVPSEVKTRGCLSLKAIGVEGNVKIVKDEKSFIVSLQDPLLDYKLPPRLFTLFHWTTLMVYRDKIGISQEEMKRLVEMENGGLSAEMMEELEDNGVDPQMFEEMINLMISAYRYYYPEIPDMEDELDEWGSALLGLMKEFYQEMGWDWPLSLDEFPYDERKRDWFLTAAPDFLAYRKV